MGREAEDEPKEGGAWGPRTGLGAKELGAEMDCSHSGAWRDSPLRDRSLGDLAPGGHWALFPSFMDGATGAQGKEMITPGSAGELESVSQLPSPVLSPTPSGSPGAPILCPPTTPFQLWCP